MSKTKLKELVRARMAKTGESYQSSHRAVTAKPGSTLRRSLLEDLLGSLAVSDAFSVAVGRVNSPHPSPDLALLKRARELRNTPVYFAQTGRIKRIITRAEHDDLLAAGAAELGDHDFIRTVPNPERTTFESDRCRACNRWITFACEVATGACLCGRQFRVTVDGLPQNTEGRKEGMSCMDCGKHFGMRLWVGERQPWSVYSHHQIHCRPCYMSTLQAAEGALKNAENLRSEFVTVSEALLGTLSDSGFSQARDVLNAQLAEIRKLHHSLICALEHGGSGRKQEVVLEEALKQFQTTKRHLELGESFRRLVPITEMAAP